MLDAKLFLTKSTQGQLKANESKEKHHIAWDIVLMSYQILRTEINRNTWR